MLSRFSLKIYVPLPNEQERQDYLNKKMLEEQKELVDLTNHQFKQLVKLTDGMSQRGFRNIFRLQRYFLCNFRHGQVNGAASNNESEQAEDCDHVQSS